MFPISVGKVAFPRCGKPIDLKMDGGEIYANRIIDLKNTNSTPKIKDARNPDGKDDRMGT